VLLQVQDYYLSLKLNSRSLSMKALYRLFVASTMLRNVKLPHKSRAHNYPKMQLSYLLLLEYWRVTKHTPYNMLRNNVHVFNEEYGEITFSILGRCVLGDTVKSKFDHLQRLFRMLPTYRSIKNEILEDQNSSNSITWRHKIDIDSDEVRMTGRFFQNTLRQIVTNKYQSYDGSKACFMNRTSASRQLVNACVPLVYNSDILPHVETMLINIKNDIEGYFLFDFMHIWTEAEFIHDSDGNETEHTNIDDDIKHDDDIGELNGDLGPDWDECEIDIFAVCRETCIDGKAIKVMKISTINVPDNDEVHVDDVYYESFMGREWMCSKDNRHVDCLTGSWSYIQPGSRVLHKIFNYSVITYFDRLAIQGKLPLDVIQTIREYSQNVDLFEIFN
jgi:hypothetical protein